MNTAELLKAGLGQHPKGMDFADIVDQSEQPPLCIHFLFGTQSKAVHPLLHTDVNKDRLNNAESSGVDLFSQFSINLRLHLVDQVRLRTHLNGGEPVRCVWFAQIPCPQRTGGAVLEAGMIDIIGTIAVDLVARAVLTSFTLVRE